MNNVILIIFSEIYNIIDENMIKNSIILKKIDKRYEYKTQYNCYCQKGFKDNLLIT